MGRCTVATITFPTVHQILAPNSRALCQPSMIFSYRRRSKCAPTIREINAQATATHSTKSSPPLRLGGVSLRQHRRQQNDTTTSLIVGSAAKWTEATIRNNNCQYLQHTTASNVVSLQFSVSLQFLTDDPSSWGDASCGYRSAP
jgi:hypothetical protein